MDGDYSWIYWIAGGVLIVGILFAVAAQNRRWGRPPNYPGSPPASGSGGNAQGSRWDGGSGSNWSETPWAGGAGAESARGGAARQPSVWDEQPSADSPAAGSQWGRQWDKAPAEDRFGGDQFSAGATAPGSQWGRQSDRAPAGDRYGGDQFAGDRFGGDQFASDSPAGGAQWNQDPPGGGFAAGPGAPVLITNPQIRRAMEAALEKGGDSARYIVRDGNDLYFSFANMPDPAQRQMAYELMRRFETGQQLGVRDMLTLTKLLFRK